MIHYVTLLTKMYIFAEMGAYCKELEYFYADIFPKLCVVGLIDGWLLFCRVSGPDSGVPEAGHLATGRQEASSLQARMADISKCRRGKMYSIALV